MKFYMCYISISEAFMKNKHFINIVKAALFAALTCVCTLLLPVPIPGGSGYVNIGDVMTALSGVFCGPLFGFLAAGLGSGLADLFAGYVIYAPATFVIKGLMAFTIALMLKANAKYMVVPSVLLAEAEMIGGYFIFEYILYGFASASAGFFGNLIQGSACLVISCVMIYVLRANKTVNRLLLVV